MLIRGAFGRLYPEDLNSLGAGSAMKQADEASAVIARECSRPKQSKEQREKTRLPRSLQSLATTIKYQSCRKLKAIDNLKGKTIPDNKKPVEGV